MLNVISRIIAPHSCIFCNTGSVALCGDCFERELSRRTQSCLWCNRLNQRGSLCPACRAHLPIARCVALLRLDEASERTIYALKYAGNREIGRLLAGHLAEILPSQFDLVCPVPSDGATRRRRGYNQAQIIAEVVAGRLDSPCQNLLVRTAHTPQVGKNRTERLAQIKGNFRTYHDLTGLRILLIDDVATTGATLGECARILRQVGVKTVSTAVLARK